MEVGEMSKQSWQMKRQLHQ